MQSTNPIAFKAAAGVARDSFEGGMKISLAELSNVLAEKAQKISDIANKTIDAFTNHFDDAVSELSSLIVKPVQKRDELIPEYNGILEGLKGRMNQTEQDALAQIDSLSEIPKNAPDGEDAQKTITAFNSFTKVDKMTIGLEKDSKIMDFEGKWQDFYYLP